MQKFENPQNLNALEINPNEVGKINPDKKPEPELAPEGLDGLNLEKGLEKPEISPEEQVENLKEETEARQEEIIKLTESVEGTKVKINEARESLGLPPTEEDPPSVSSDKEKLEKLQAEKEGLEKQSEELISKREKERLIREEKEKILQEKIDGLFKEFESLNPQDFESIFKTGKNKEGGKMESGAMGALDPETAKSLASAFKEGIKFLPKILESLPELLKKFDEDLDKEAEERVNKKLEEEKKKIEEEEQKNKEKPAEENLEDETKHLNGDVLPGESKQTQPVGVEVPENTQ